jgi:hypothetical protein
VFPNSYPLLDRTSHEAESDGASSVLRRVPPAGEPAAGVPVPGGDAPVPAADDPHGQHQGGRADHAADRRRPVVRVAHHRELHGVHAARHQEAAGAHHQAQGHFSKGDAREMALLGC